MKNYEKKHLGLWKEAIGTLERIESCDSEITVILTCAKQIAITIPKNEPQTSQLNKLLGKQISIMETDEQGKEIVIRSLNKSRTTHNTQSNIPKRIDTLKHGRKRCSRTTLSTTRLAKEKQDTAKTIAGNFATNGEAHSDFSDREHAR